MNLKKDKIQSQALKKWYKEKRATCVLQTGLGKTFLFFKCLIKSKCKQCLFLAETDIRLDDVLKDQIKFKELYGVDPLEGVNFKFMLYQSAYKRKLEDIFPEGKAFVCADEIDFAVSPVYWRFFDLSDWSNHFFLGLTATLDNTSRVIYENQDIGTKKEVVNNKFPICFNYGVEEAVEDGTTRPLVVYTLLHNLDDKKKTVKAGNSKVSWMQTEKEAYNYLEDNFKKTLFLPKSNSKDFLIKAAARKRADFLYNLDSKVELCKKLLEILLGRTVVYGIHNKSLFQLGIPCVVDAEPKHKEYLEQFRSLQINQIAGNKKLIRGANLNKVDNIIHFAYYSKEGEIRQKVGRMRDDLPSGKVIIFLTKETQEQKWYDSMITPLLVFPQKEIKNVQEVI